MQLFRLIPLTCFFICTAAIDSDVYGQAMCEEFHHIFGRFKDLNISGYDGKVTFFPGQNVNGELSLTIINGFCNQAR